MNAYNPSFESKAKEITTNKFYDNEQNTMLMIFIFKNDFALITLVDHNNNKV